MAKQKLVVDGTSINIDAGGYISITLDKETNTILESLKSLI